MNFYRYDHPDILAGQGKLKKFKFFSRQKYIFNKNLNLKKGTMGLEIIEQVPDVDAIVVPTGGAGLLAGNKQNQ